MSATSPSTTVSNPEMLVRVETIWVDWYAPNQPDSDGNWVPPLPLNAPGGLPDGWRYGALVSPAALKEVGLSNPNRLPDHPDHWAYHLLYFDEIQRWVLAGTWVSRHKCRLLNPIIGPSLGDVRDQLAALTKPRTRRYEKLVGLTNVLSPLIPAEVAFLFALGNPWTALPEECYSPTFGLSLLDRHTPAPCGT